MSNKENPPLGVITQSLGDSSTPCSCRWPWSNSMGHKIKRRTKEKDMKMGGGKEGWEAENDQNILYTCVKLLVIF